MWKCSVKFNALAARCSRQCCCFLRRDCGGSCHLAAKPDVCRESLTDPNSLFAQIVHIIEEGGWTVFRNMPLIFAVGLPIGLAKQAQGRACLAVMVSFLTWNYFINAMGMTWEATSASISSGRGGR